LRSMASSAWIRRQYITNMTPTHTMPVSQSRVLSPTQPPEQRAQVARMADEAIRAAANHLLTRERAQRPGMEAAERPRRPCPQRDGQGHERRANEGWNMPLTTYCRDDGIPSWPAP